VNNTTLGMIYAIKRSENGRKQAVIDYMSEITGSPKEDYYDNELLNIVGNAFVDYLKTADNPAYVVQCFFGMRNIYRDNELERMLSVLQLTRVKDNYGQYINGFREIKNDIK